jgi:hypothetical protein
MLSTAKTALRLGRWVPSPFTSGVVSGSRAGSGTESPRAAASPGSAERAESRQEPGRGPAASGLHPLLEVRLAGEPLGSEGTSGGGAGSGRLLGLARGSGPAGSPVRAASAARPASGLFKALSGVAEDESGHVSLEEAV